MEKILILVLLVINDCDQVVMDCTMSYNTCAEAAGNSPGDVCTCYGSFIVCVWDGACVSETDHNNMLQNCASSGCSNTECLGIADPPVNVPVDAPVSEPVTFTPVASPACDYAIADECSSRYSSCVGNGTFDEICNCYGPYIYCYFYEANCITLSDYENAVQQCEQFGCTSQQCTSSSSSPIGNTPIEAPFPINAPVSSCNFDNVIPCQDKFINCTSGNYTSTETCDCYGPYLNCVYDTGCITTDDYWNAVRSCEQIGCSLEQCTENSTVTTPVNAPIEVPSSSQCNSQSATVCANEYNTCVNAAGTNINALCSCYGPYFDCLFDIGCLTYSQYQNVVQNCAQSGCSLQQCSGNSTVVAPVTAPIEVPTASTPIGPTPTSTSPVSAPSTVICLQPWELVLIVVGSVLAGVGIAAIIGVIIYLSRGRSGVKKTNKYSKLQRY